MASASAHPPTIPVRQTTKSMYRPISKLNGDQLPMLRRVKRPELSGRIALYNHYTDRVLDTALNVSFRQHEHTMETIRKEQAQIYKSLCRIRKQKRRVQRDEHEERRQEIRNMFNRQRRRHQMRRVVAKFRENVIKKRAERMIQHAAQVTDDPKAPVLSAQQLLKYAGGLRRHTQPNVTTDIHDVSTDTAKDVDGDASTNAVSIQENESAENAQGLPSLSSTTGEGYSESADKAAGQRDGEKVAVTVTQRNSLHKSKKISKTKTHNNKHSKPDGHLEAIPEIAAIGANSNSKRKSDKPKGVEAATSREKIKTTLSSQSLPSISLNTHQNASCGFSEDTGADQGEGRSSHDSLIDRVVRENTFEEQDAQEFSGRITHHNIVLSGGFENNSEEDDDDDYEYENRNVAISVSRSHNESKGKKRRGNMVRVIENERAERAKARTRILDEEPITRYSRKRQEKISAMYGMPKRLEFVPPSGKVRHEQGKLIRREQDKDIQSHINIENFFHDVFQTKETAYKQPTIEKEEAPKKPTLSLASVLSQMYTTSEPVTGDKNSMESVKACQYLRVYNPFTKKFNKGRSGQGKPESSWDVAERKLRAGFMALSFLQ